jgi:hypothetical protein
MALLNSAVCAIDLRVGSITQQSAAAATHRRELEMFLKRARKSVVDTAMQRWVREERGGERKGWRGEEGGVGVEEGRGRGRRRRVYLLVVNSINHFGHYPFSFLPSTLHHP